MSKISIEIVVIILSDMKNNNDNEKEYSRVFADHVSP